MTKKGMSYKESNYRIYYYNFTVINKGLVNFV
ncbi:hypothetical protein POKO110462_22705 [Pontibacter korlensis]